jgi:hypothetical protein
MLLWRRLAFRAVKCGTYALQNGLWQHQRP